MATNLTGDFIVPNTNESSDSLVVDPATPTVVQPAVKLIFSNFAGKPDIDDLCAAELEQAGIKVTRMEIFRDRHPEVKTCVRGELHMWMFTRYWYYWAANGPGIPPNYAMELHSRLGQEVRVEGHCMCPSPIEWNKGFAIGSYHIDTQRGLNAFAAMLNKIVEDVND